LSFDSSVFSTQRRDNETGGLDMTENSYTILMVGWNSKDWISTCLQSCLNQNHSNFDVIAIDAQTDDGTFDYLKDQESKHENFKVVRNNIRQYQPQNIYDGVMMAKDDSIIVTVDFDDWLPHENVLATLDQYYNEDVWMTYGSYVMTNGQVNGFGRYDDRVVQNNLYRQDNWRATHLRTFRKKLYSKIKVDDLKDDNGEWFRVAGDLTFMWPMLEMSGGKFEFIPEPLYVYNLENQNSVNQGDKAPEQIKNEKIMRGRTPYKSLETL